MHHSLPSTSAKKIRASSSDGIRSEHSDGETQYKRSFNRQRSINSQRPSNNERLASNENPTNNQTPINNQRQAAAERTFPMRSTVEPIERRRAPSNRGAPWMFQSIMRSNSWSHSSINIPPSLDVWIASAQQHEGINNRKKSALAILASIPSNNRKKPKTKLNLNKNQLDDLPEIIKQSYAQFIDLSNNILTRIPEPLTDVVNLVKLNLSKNEIAEIPQSFSKLAALKTLDLSSNQLAELPNTISQLERLQFLNLNNNQITELCGHLSNLRELSTLYVANNCLQRLTPNIAGMVHLKDIDISNNPEIESIPLEWERLFVHVLQHANLRNTNLKAFIPMEHYPRELKTLNLENNPELTSLPKSLGPMKQNRIPFLLTSTKKDRPIAIYTNGSRLILGLAAEGRVQIKHYMRAIPAGKKLPVLSLSQTRINSDDVDINDNLSLRHFDGEPRTGEAPKQLVLNQAALFEKWEELKREGFGPNRITSLKQSSDRQNLLTIFAYTYGSLQKLRIPKFNVPEFNLALNVIMSMELELPLIEELEAVGAIQPLSSAAVNEAQEAVKHLEILSADHVRLAANQLEPIARQKDTSLIFSDSELTKKKNAIMDLNNSITAEQITRVFELAKSNFRQDLINKISQVYTHLKKNESLYELDGIETAMFFQSQLAEKLNLIGNIGSIKIPDTMHNYIGPHNVETIKSIVLALESIDDGALFKTYLESNSFWNEYVNELAELLTVSDPLSIECAVQQIKADKGWTPEYQKLGLSLFRQDKLNLISHYEVFSQEEGHTTGNPNLISLNYQIQLATQLDLPEILQKFPEEVASVICWRISPDKAEKISSAVLEYEQVNKGKMFEDFLKTQSFWAEHQQDKEGMQSNQTAYHEAHKVASNMFEWLGLRIYKNPFDF